MDSVETSKPHAVCLPLPTQGHVDPMMQLAKLLHSRGFFITFVNTEINHRRFIRSKGPDSVRGLPDFRFETIPDGLPPSDLDATQDIPALCDSTRKNCLGPFLELLSKLNSLPQVPNVTCIVSDGVMSFAIKAAEVLGVSQVQFWTASACSFMGYLQFNELTERGIFPFQSKFFYPTLYSHENCLEGTQTLTLSDETFLTDGTLDQLIDWVPGMSNIRLRDIPSFIRANDSNDILFDFMRSEVQNCLKAPAIIFNTFDELENEVLQAIAAKFPRIYTIGPLHLLVRNIPDGPSKSLNLSLWKQDTSCIEWLNKMEPNSVVYVNYGSLTVMSSHHLIEFAWGLANSKYPFLWIVRPDVVMGESAVLPIEFMEEIKGRGFVTSWCPQQQVLSHPAIGVFLTHCGWNSFNEAVSEGVPFICWPFFADQQTNCRYACTTWDIGMEINPDVKRDDVKSLVKEMMEGDNGPRKRKNALEWKRKAKDAISVGGSSCTNFDRIIKESLRHN